MASKLWVTVGRVSLVEVRQGQAYALEVWGQSEGVRKEQSLGLWGREDVERMLIALSTWLESMDDGGHPVVSAEGLE